MQEGLLIILIILPKPLRLTSGPAQGTSLSSLVGTGTPVSHLPPCHCSCPDATSSIPEGRTSDVPCPRSSRPTACAPSSPQSPGNAVSLAPEACCCSVFCPFLLPH